MTPHLLAERDGCSTPMPVSARPCEQSRTDLARLLEQAGRGDVEAFADFYDRTCATAFHLALAVCGDSGQAGELLQRLYVSAWVRAAHQSSSGLSPLAWLLAEVVRSARPGEGQPTRG